MRWLLAMVGGFRVVVVVLLVLIVVYASTTVVPAGHVGVQDFFGAVSDRVLSPGINVVVPGTRVIKFSVQTCELKETAAVPTSEGLIVNLDVSLLFRLRPEAAARVYKTVGSHFEGVVIEPQLRSAIRDVTAEYEAKFLYSASRELVAQNQGDRPRRQERPAHHPQRQVGQPGSEGCRPSAFTRAPTQPCGVRERTPTPTSGDRIPPPQARKTRIASARRHPLAS